MRVYPCACKFAIADSQYGQPGSAETVAWPALPGVAVGAGVAVGVAAAVGVAVADAVAALDEFAAADALGDGEVELVHPAAATHIRSTAHIAIIAACFFIKVIPRKMDVHCE